MSAAWRTLLGAFCGGGGYALLGAAVPALQSFPVFSWIGLSSVTEWGWELALSPGYIGQGEHACICGTACQFMSPDSAPPAFARARWTRLTATWRLAN